MNNDHVVVLRLNRVAGSSKLILERLFFFLNYSTPKLKLTH